MDIVYTSLTRRSPTVEAEPGPNEGAEVVDVLWVHATPEDRLEHASSRITPERVDLLLFLRPTGEPAPGAERQAAELLHRSHRASPLLQRRYLPPAADLLPPAPGPRTAH
ncbi:hypothetical protein [Kitasatospora sp. NPDC094015]|uniref:hypothetical protein n=1 Tax=Kitasatospora sp. NPDC094015 TaxID=3155205 RepID=UPI00331D6403